MTAETGSWWALAFSKEVEDGKPHGYFAHGEPIVLFRDHEGVIRALENRCPHRRVPLSLGKVRSEGWLQCGYHGWSFDGANGRCMAIPNLSANERVPPSYGVLPYRAAEKDGLVYVTADATAAAPPDPLFTPGHRRFFGRQMIGLDHDHYVTALMDGPELLLDCAGIRIANILVADPHLDQGWMVTERAAFWTGQTSFDAFVREYRLIFRLALRPDTGEAWISFTTPDGSIVAAAHWAITPSARGVTAVLWHSFAGDARGIRPALLRVMTALGRPPIRPRQSIDMASLAELLPGPSEHWQRGQHHGLYGDAVNQERVSV